MTGPTLDPRFTASLRTALAEQVTVTAGARPGRRWRAAAVSGGAIALALTGGSIAVAEGLVPLPFRTGALYDVPLAPGVMTTQVGSLTIPVDDIPEGTNGVRFDVACLEPGTIGFPDGASISCTHSDAAQAALTGSTSSYSVDLAADSGPLVFEVTSGMHWMLKVTWLERTPTDWQTNTRGETFGVVKPDGSSPDLVSVWATNGELGYYRVSDYTAASPMPASPAQAAQWSMLPARVVAIPVYASDGETVLGEFELTVHAPSGG